MVVTSFMKLNIFQRAWQGLTYEKGSFSTKRAAYSISVVITSYILVHLQDKITWDLLAAYALHCTGPGALREFLNYKTKRNETVADTVLTVTDSKKEEQ